MKFYIVSAVLMSFSLSVLFSQTRILGEKTNINYSFPENTSIEVDAYSWTRYSEGFTFEAKPGFEFTSRLLEFEENFDQDAETGGHPEEEISNLVGNTGVVGAIPGNFSISPTGAATYSIPIECPPGVRGMTPQLSIFYNSQAGNGIAGYGWHIGGLSSIMRSPKTIYENNTVKDIEWDHHDCFALDGQALKTDTIIGTSKYYFLENQPKVKVIQYYYNDQANTYFEVFSGDGKVFEYKKKYKISTNSTTVECRYHSYYTPDGIPLDAGTLVYTHTNQDEENIFSWHLSRVTDQFNNFIIYTYEDRSVSGNYSLGAWGRDSIEIPEEQKLYRIYEYGSYEFYHLPELVAVEYGHSTQGFIPIGEQRDKKIYRIELEYEARPDHINTYISGRLYVPDRRLSHIKINHDSIYTIRKYDLTYNVNNWSFLRDVKLTGLNGAHYNKTVFDWTDQSISYSNQTNFSFPHSFPPVGQTYYDDRYNVITKKFFPVYLNDDDKTDFLVIYEMKKNIPLDKKYVWGAYITGTGTTLTFAGDGTFPGNERFHILDRDLDGIQEIYFQEIQDHPGNDYLKLHCYQYNSASGLVESHTTGDFSIALNAPVLSPVKIISADFEGDGEMESLIYQHSGIGFYSSDNFENSFDMELNNIQGYKLLDINNNDKAEIFRLTSRGEIWEYNDEVNNFVQLYSDEDMHSGDYGYPGDFNGDGNSDLLYFDVSMDHWRVYISDGRTLIDSIVVAPGLSTDVDLFDFETLLIYDFNGDGLSDILETIPSLSDLKLYLSNGDGFESPVMLHTNFPFPLEFTGQSNDELNPEVYFNNSSQPGAFSIANGVFGSLKTAINGMGEKLDFQYKNKRIPYYGLSEKMTTSPGPSSFNPVIPDIFLIRTLSTVKSDHYTTSYQLEKPLTFPGSAGRGFLGYGYSEVIYSDISGTYQTSGKTYVSIHQKDTLSKYQVLTDSTKSFSNSTQVSGREYKYSSEHIGDHTYIVLDNITEFDLLNGFRTKSCFDSYNSYIQPEITFKQVFQSVNELVGTDSSKIQYGGVLNISRHIVGLPLSLKTYNKKPGSPALEKIVENSYNTNGSIAYQYMDRDSGHEIKKEYLYDEFGNIAEKTIKALNDPDITGDQRFRTWIYSYTPDGRFPDTIINPLGEMAFHTYYMDLGLTKTSSNNHGHVTNFEYDGMGDLIKTTSPTGLVTLSGRRWNESHVHAPPEALFYSFSKTMGSKETLTFIDSRGQAIRTLSTGFNGETVYHDRITDQAGRDSVVYLPYYSQDSRLYSTRYFYDGTGRIDSILNADTTTVSYSYNQGVITTCSGKAGNTHCSVTRINPLGQTIETEDEQGNKVFTEYNAAGLPSEIRLNGGPNKIQMFYDSRGNRTKLIDPNAGTTTSRFNAFGALTEFTNANGHITEYQYDNLGRLSSQARNGKTHTYTYDEGFVSLVSEVTQNFPSHTVSNTYDSYGRVITTTEIFDGHTLTYEYAYDLLSRLVRTTYPDSGNYTIFNSYNDYGYLETIRDKNRLLWECEQVNLLGQVTRYNQNSSPSVFTYDDFGMLKTRSFAGGTKVFNFGYDDHKNLTMREDESLGLKETFEYDEMNRLVSGDYYQNDALVARTLEVEYDAAGMGNIISKSGVAETINYGENAGPHALTSIENEGTDYHPWPQKISYTDFNKISSITDTLSNGDTLVLSLDYGLDDRRRKSTLTGPDQLSKTKYFFGNYEIITDNAGTREYLYVNSPTGMCAIVEKTGSNTKTWRTFTDHLGSVVYAENMDNTLEKRHFSYDAWGNARRHNDWQNREPLYEMIGERGFTGHEHLAEFDLINMNGRVYDPVLGRFLSADPFVQSPGTVDGYNRYSYCLNNPLGFVDPSGYVTEATEQQWINSYWYQDSGPGLGGYGCQIGRGPSEAGPTYEQYMRSKGYFYGINENEVLGWQKIEGFTIINDGSQSFHEFFLNLKNTYESEELILSLESGYNKIWVVGISTVFSESRKTSFQGINTFGFDIGQIVNKNKYFAAGKVTAFSFDFAFGGGGGIVIGKVRDNYGNKRWFFSTNANFGYGLSLDFYRAEILNVHGNDFNAYDYEGFSGGFNWSVLFFGGQKSGDKLMRNFNNGIIGNTYMEEGNSLSISPIRFGAWWSNSKTWLLD